MPVLVIVAGPNGSGKTTLVRTGALTGLIAVPSLSINADDIAQELAGGAQPSAQQSLLAAQRSDALLDDQIAMDRSVLVETVLSSDKFKNRVVMARDKGFQIALVYVSVRIPELNIARVANRFLLGGHDVPVDRITARRTRSHQMFGWFAEAADQVYVFDNSTLVPALAAFKDGDQWTIRDLDLLADDLAETIRNLAIVGKVDPGQA